MRLNIKKVFLVILILALIMLGIWAGISLTNKEQKPIDKEKNNSTKSIINNLNEEEEDVENKLTENTETNKISNSSVTNNTLDITRNTVDNNTTTNDSVTEGTNSQADILQTPKTDLNSYLEKFSLICYLDSRTKNLDKELKRNEDYIDIAMLFAKEHNINEEEVNGKRAVSIQIIHKIISEIRGRSTQEALPIGDVLYKYDSESNKYYFNHDDERIAHIFDIEENTEENGVINLKYTCCFPSATQISNNNFSGLGKYVITMELKENSSYEYSKYKIQNYQFVIE